MVALSQRFPFPLEEDRFRYVNNLKPLESPCCIQATEEYRDEIGLKRRLLTEHPERCFSALPNTKAAQWEALELLVNQLAEQYPNCFTLEKRREQWIFRNLLLGEIHKFTLGDEESLGMQPLDWIGRHVQEDLILMMQRDDELYLEAGQLCFPSVWSLAFDVGMAFHDIHQPVPWPADVAEKIRRFLLRVEAGKPWTRLNWGMQVGGRLDIPPENYNEWGPQRFQVTADNVSDEVMLRVEEQCVLRLPGSNALLFTIHTYQKSIGELSRNPEWVKRLHSVLSSLPEEVAEYKGLSAYRNLAVDFLEKCV